MKQSHNETAHGSRDNHQEELRYPGRVVVDVPLAEGPVVHDRFTEEKHQHSIIEQQ